MAEAKPKKEKVKGVVTCSYCAGTGKHQDQKCVVCGGSGQVEVVDMTQKCQWCKGNGFLMKGIPCTVCGGTGFTRPTNKQRLF